MFHFEKFLQIGVDQGSATRGPRDISTGGYVMYGMV